MSYLWRELKEKLKDVTQPTARGVSSSPQSIKKSLEKSLWNISFMNAYLCMLLTIKTIRNYFKRSVVWLNLNSVQLTMSHSVKVHLQHALENWVEEGFLHIFFVLNLRDKVHDFKEMLSMLRDFMFQNSRFLFGRTPRSFNSLQSHLGDINLSNCQFKVKLLKYYQNITGHVYDMEIPQTFKTVCVSKMSLVPVPHL